MNVSDALNTLESLIGERGAGPSELDSAAALDVMVSFYGSQRAEGLAPLEEDSDMLLFEWGAFDFGQGPSFQYGLTRQFILAGAEGDDGFRQLRLVLHYDPSDEASEIGRGHRWCHHPDQLSDFRAFVEATRATSFVEGRAPTGVELVFDHV